jgi:hypothetical protein
MNEWANPSSLPASSSITPPGAMTFGQILDHMWRLMRARWRLFFGIAGVPAAAVFLFLVAMMSYMLTIIGPQLAGKPVILTAFPIYLAVIVGAGEPMLLLVYALYLPAAIYAATKADAGVTVTVSHAYRVALSRFGSYLWLMILFFLYLAVPVAVVGAVMGVGMLLMHHASGMSAGHSLPFVFIPMLVLFYLCIMVYSILIMLRFALAYPASVEENLSAWAALGRSTQLTRGAKGRIFLVILVVYVAICAAQFLANLILFALAAVVALVSILAHLTVGSATFYVLVGLGVVGYGMIILGSALVTYSALTTALAVLYGDQRRRKDGIASPPVQTG